jgi:hypothetical protein
MEKTAITDLETAQAKIIQLEKELATKTNKLHQQKEELEYTNSLLDEVMAELEQYHAELSLLKRSQSISNDNVNQLVDQDTWQKTQSQLNQALELLEKYQQQLEKITTLIEKQEICNEIVVTNEKTINLKSNHKIYKLLVNPDGFISIAEYSSYKEEPIIVIEKITDPFSNFKHLNVFRKPGEGYCPFYVEQASEELQQQGISYVLFWVKTKTKDNNIIFIEWGLNAKGNYIKHKRVIDKNEIQRLFSHLYYTNFPGYKQLFKTINQEKLQIDKVDSSLSNALKIIVFEHDRSSTDKLQDISIVEFLNTNRNWQDETKYVNLEDLQIVSNLVGYTISSQIGSIDIYKTIQEKGDLVYFEQNEIKDKLDEGSLCEFKKIEQLFDESSQRSIFHQKRNSSHHKNNTKYSVIRLLTGYAWCQCPFTGKILKSNKSIPIGTNHITYYFESLHPFFMICYGGWYSQINAIYLPIQNICIRFKLMEQWDNLSDTIKNLLSNFYIYQNLILDYLIINQPKNKCLLLNCRENLGHYIWQELSGLSLLFDFTTLSRYIQNYLINPESRYKEQKLNPEDVFPELKSIKYIQEEGKESIIKATLMQNLFLFKVEDIVISKFIPNRIQSISCKDFNLLKSLMIEKSKGTQILMVNLRLHNKIWINCVEVLSKFFNNLKKPIVVVYDGFEDVIPIINSIKEKVKNPLVKHIDATSLTISETCSIVAIIDAFIATIGSGLVLPTWIYNKPGIAHGDPKHLTQKQLWKLVMPEGYNSDTVSFLNRNEIKPLSNRMYSNYKIDANIIIPKIENIFDIS